MNTLLAKYATYEEGVMGFQAGIIALAGGGQGGTALTKKWNTIGTCVSDYDSVKLIQGRQGMKQVVINGTSKALAVYCYVGDFLNGVQNDYVIVPSGSAAVFECVSQLEWMSYEMTQNASGILSVKNAISTANIISSHSSPITLVKAVPNFFISHILSSVFYNKGSSAFTAGGEIQFITDTGVNEQASCSLNFTSASSFSQNTINAVSGDVISNKALLLKTANADYANGNGSAIIYTQYRLIKI